MKVCELSGTQLDYLVAKQTGMLRMIPGTILEQLGGYSPSTKWAHGGPIIEKNNISISNHGLGGYDTLPYWQAQNIKISSSYSGETPLIAAMRAYAASVYGDELPDQPK